MFLLFILLPLIIIVFLCKYYNFIISCVWCMKMNTTGHLTCTKDILFKYNAECLERHFI